MHAITSFSVPAISFFFAGTVLVIIGASGSDGFAWRNFAGKPVQSALLDQLGSSHVRDRCARSRSCRRPQLQNTMTLAAGIIGSTLGLSGLLLGSYAANRYSMPELADPSEHLAHLAVGVLALWAWSNRKAEYPRSV